MSDCKLEDYYPPNDEYKCTFGKEYQRIALEELREEPYIREQSIAYLREWIAKHPTIKKCRTDSAFLLRFLRTRKYNMPAVCENIETYLACQKIYPKWLDNLDPMEPSVWKLISNGYILPLPERDSLGRKVILIRSQKIDPEKFTFQQIMRAMSITFETILDEDLNQITGYVGIHDFNGAKMAHLGLCTFNDVRNFINIVQGGSPMRQKMFIFLNIPSFASMFIDFSLSLLTEKHRSRIKIMKSIGEVSKHIDKHVLPLEYGGTIPVDNMLKDFLKKVKESGPRLVALHKMNIEIDTNSSVVKKIVPVENDLNFGVQGSFRKLNLD